MTQNMLPQTRTACSTAAQFSTLVLALTMLIVLGGCGGGGGGSSAPPASPTDTGMVETDLGEWETIVVDGISVGYMNTTHGLSARWDTSGENPTITASSPMRPTVEGSWKGMWGGFVGEELDTVDGGTAEVNVTIQGEDVHATLTYNDIDGIGNVTTERTRVNPTGRFSPSATVTVDGVPLTYTGEGQFGGTEQRGVVGHMSGIGLRSVFYGDRTD